MKVLLGISLIIITIIGCEKNEQDTLSIKKADILGTWVNLLNEKDTLFIQENIIERTDSTGYIDRTTPFGPSYAYSYIIFKDSIKIKYAGSYTIYVIEKSFKVNIDNKEMILTIENLNNYFPYYDGDMFKKVLII